MNFGYNDPPRDPQKLQEIAERYGVSMDELSELADSYESRPPFIIDIAKNHLLTSAKLIGEIIERKRAEEETAKAKNFLESSLTSTPDGVLLLDKQGKFSYVNPTFLKWLGREAKDFIGKTVREISPLIMNPETTKIIAERVKRRLETGEHIVGVEIEFIDKDGKPMPISYSAAGIRDDKGNILGEVVFIRDITERKRAEEALRESKRRLEETLSDLQVTQRQIIQQERLRALGQLASGIAHDFNNVLSPILSYTDLLLMLPETLDDKEKVVRFLRTMNTAAKDAASIVNRLRRFYRHREEGNIFSIVNLNELMEQTIELTQPRWKDQAQSNGIAINIKTDFQKNTHINGNDVELREVLTNLILNAVDAMPKGGTIILSVGTDGEHIVLEVSDTGIGMTEEVRQRCLEPFFSTKGERGTGLGLSIVYGIIQRHGGMVDIKSELGKGTTFIIRLPINTKQQAAARVQREEPELPSLHVLVVDDEQMVRDVITEFLTVDGHSAEAASSGREGLEKFYAGRFDLVVTDLAMPDMSGKQLASTIKQIAPNKPIILLTGFGGMMEASGETPAGVDCLVSKPVTLTGFREALAKVMANL